MTPPPSVSRARALTYSGTTTITDFDDGIEGQSFMLQANASFTVAVNGGTGSAIRRSDNSDGDLEMVSGDAVRVTMHTNGTSWWLSDVTTNDVQDSEVVTATNVITTAESGRTFYLNSSTEFVSTLPAPALGLNYKFIVTGAPSGASYTVVTNASANIMEVLLLDIVGELVFATGRDVVTFVDGASLAGDRLEVESDGTNWFCKAFSGADGGITTGQTA